jgi:hypothetical protein
METIYRKTERGIMEMATREQRLAPRLRSALILIDGKRLLRELQALLGPCHEEALRALEELGLIEGRRPIYITDPLPSATAARPSAGQEAAALRRQSRR